VSPSASQCTPYACLQKKADLLLYHVPRDTTVVLRINANDEDDTFLQCLRRYLMTSAGFWVSIFFATSG
jgi:hypothetical protein